MEVPGTLQTETNTSTPPATSTILHLLEPTTPIGFPPQTLREYEKSYQPCEICRLTFPGSCLICLSSRPCSSRAARAQGSPCVDSYDIFHFGNFGSVIEVGRTLLHATPIAWPANPPCYISGSAERIRAGRKFKALRLGRLCPGRRRGRDVRSNLHDSYLAQPPTSLHGSHWPKGMFPKLLKPASGANALVQLLCRTHAAQSRPEYRTSIAKTPVTSFRLTQNKRLPSGDAYKPIRQCGNGVVIGQKSEVTLINPTACSQSFQKLTTDIPALRVFLTLAA